MAPPDGIGDVLTSPGSSTVVVTAALHPGAADIEQDGALEAARKDAGVQARLVEHYPDRFWDHDLGPRQPHLFALDISDPDGELPKPRDLTPSPPWAGWLESVEFALSDDGARVGFGAATHHGKRFKADLAVLDTAGGAVRTLVDDHVQHGAVSWSPDGSTIAASQMDLGSPSVPARFHLVLVDVATGSTRPVAEQWDGLVTAIRWTRDGRALLVTADEHGHTPVFRIDLDGAVTRLTASGAYSSLALSPDGATLYAIRSHVNEVPVPVALDINLADQQARVLASPIQPASTGTRLEEVTARAADGTEVHCWLVLPEHSLETPLPLAVLVHGGPFAAWSGWSWRWSATLHSARGWAVLLPNPRLSTGYGHEHIASSWGDWATLPATDILAAVDAVVARPDIDADRVALLGGSYGGYMACWLAVTTDRFRAIVNHAGVWDLQSERGTSDVGYYLDFEFGSPLADEATWRRQSPHLRADSLHAPMLVIHGVRDQRVSLGNAQALWTDLQIREVPSRMLIFPDENHWILKRQNARIWNQTVFAFLDEHVLGKDFARPGLL
jgi:dipeptidyl aminopeptidase/acylaminoacyl peptidase